jgi:hypothetical protein
MDKESQAGTPEFQQTHCEQKVEILSMLNLVVHKVTKGLLRVAYIMYFSNIRA